MTPYYSPQSYKTRASIGYLIRRARSLMMTHVEAAFGPYEITFMQWLVLMQLRDEAPRTAGEISRELCHDSGALTRLVDQLAQRGLIDRSRCEKDRRILTLALTDTGRHLVESLIPIVVDLLNGALAGFTHRELDTLTSLLSRLTNDLTNFSPARPRMPARSQNG